MLEVTEREMVDADEQTRAIFDALDELGVLIAIDDFGTGHSSLCYLQMFHVDIIKIDRSFIKGMKEEGPPDISSKTSWILPIAWGWLWSPRGETQEQVEMARHYGIDYLQGFYFAKPLPPAQFTDLLASATRPEPSRRHAGVRLFP